MIRRYYFNKLRLMNCFYINKHFTETYYIFGVYYGWKWFFMTKKRKYKIISDFLNGDYL